MGGRMMDLVSINIAKRIVALFVVIFVALGVMGAYSPNGYIVEDIGRLGGVGDGATINNTVFQTAFSAVANGGNIRLPCGVYKLTATPTVTVAAGQHVEINGSGSDCTVIYMTGAVDGPTFNYSNQWSSVGISNLTIKTDQTGGTTCLRWAGTFSNPSSAYAATSYINNVTFIGSDGYGAATKYCGAGFVTSNISNININGMTYQGIASRAGTAYSIVGLGNNGTYAVVANITNSTFNNCNIGVNYGDWVQGVTLTNMNITGCNYGVNTPSSPAGILDQLSSVNSQFNTYVCSICVSDPSFNAIMIANSVFINNANTIAIEISGTNFNVIGNQITGTTTTGTTGILLNSTFGNGGVIAGNAILFFGAGISVNAASQSQVRISGNEFVSNTVDYNINTSSRGVIVNDDQPRNMAVINAQIPCGPATKFAKVEVADSPTATFNATLTVGGAANFVGAKCDGARYYVD